MKTKNLNLVTCVKVDRGKEWSKLVASGDALLHHSSRPFLIMFNSNLSFNFINHP